MRVLHSPRHLRHQRHRSSRFTTQCRGRLQQTAPTSKLHVEKRQPVIALAHFIDWQNIRMIEARRGLGLAPKTCQRFLRIGVIRQDSFQRHDATRMPLTRPINDAHPSAPDFFKDLIIPYAPIGVTYIKFPEQVIKRFRLRRIYGGRVIVVPVRTDACGEHTAQTKTASDARCRSAFGAGSRLVFEVHRYRNGGHTHGRAEW